MKPRQWILLGFFVALGVTYVLFFTEWLRPAPIQIASQIRFAIQPKPRFGRPVKKVVTMPKPGQATGEVRVVQVVQTNRPAQKDPYERITRPEKGTLDQAPGGVARVTFSLDDWYHLTRLRVEDVPTDGSRPNVLWEAKGKSMLLNSLLYGKTPEGMKPMPEGSSAEPLVPGAPYRLIVEAGRRRGTNSFTTIALQPAE